MLEDLRDFLLAAGNYPLVGKPVEIADRRGIACQDFNDLLARQRKAGAEHLARVKAAVAHL